jgi:hypothetical protein
MRLMYETDHSGPRSVEFKNVWRFTSVQSYLFEAWSLIKRSEKFTVSLYEDP